MKSENNKFIGIKIVYCVFWFIFLTFNLFAEEALDDWYFSNRPLVNEKSLSAITFVNNMYVAVGNDGTIKTSSNDGVSWIKRISGTTNDLFGIANGNNTFVAVGDGGIILTSSDNGISWIKITSEVTNKFVKIAYGNNTFVAIGDSGTIVTSFDNGVTWTKRTLGINNNLFGIAYGNNTFVAVGDEGTILTSSDKGVTWTNITSGTDNILFGIAFGNNIFAAVGDKGTILTSSDNGVTWIKIASGTTNVLYGITYANNIFAAVGDCGKIVTSSDYGITWINRPSVTGFYGIYAITYGNYTFMAVGSNGMIIQSAPIVLMPIISASPAKLNFDSVNIGSVLSNKTITVKNIGSSDLIINTASITGTNANEFSIKNDNCSNQTIKSLTSHTLKIFFSPVSEGQKTADLLIPSNDTYNTTIIVSLNGIGYYDTILPFVISTSPENNATDVANDISITAAFSEQIDFSTINDTTFTVNGAAGLVSYDEENKIATFKPSSFLKYNTTYTVIISKNIKDIANNSMDLDYTWNFTTIAEPDMILPKIKSVSPQSGAVNVPVNTAITATFSEPMNEATINNDTFIVNGITGVVIYDSTKTQAKFTPSGNLVENTTYLVTIKTGVKDLANNPIKQYTWNFTTSKTNNIGGGKKGCIISEIAHNIKLDKYIYVLTRFRDRYLSDKIMYKNKIVTFYYTQKK